MVIPRKKGRTHVLRLIRELYTTRPSGTRTSISTALSSVYRLLNRRSIVILASDFQDKDFDKEHRITSQKHDLMNLIIHDSLEESLPRVADVPRDDAETGEQVWLDTSSQKVRAALEAKRRERQAELREYMVKNKVDSIEV